MKVFTLILLIAFITPAFADEKPLPVFIVAGHNNARGWRTPADKAPEDIKQAFDSVYDLNLRNGKWQPLKLGSGNRAFGPAHGFAAEYRKHNKEPFGIATFGVPFSTIAEHWNPNGGSSYEKMKAALAKAAEERPIKVVAFLWVNGQNDAKKEDLANAYSANLKRLIEGLRKNFENPELAFISIRMHDGRWPFKNVIRDAQTSYKDEHYAWIDTDDVPRPDGPHYTPEGYVMVGKRMAAKYHEVSNQ